MRKYYDSRCTTNITAALPMLFLILLLQSGYRTVVWNTVVAWKHLPSIHVFMYPAYNTASIHYSHNIMRNELQRIHCITRKITLLWTLVTTGKNGFDKTENAFYCEFKILKAEKNTENWAKFWKLSTVLTTEQKLRRKISKFLKIEQNSKNWAKPRA